MSDVGTNPIHVEGWSLRADVMRRARLYVGEYPDWSVSVSWVAAVSGCSVEDALVAVAAVLRESRLCQDAPAGDEETPGG